MNVRALSEPSPFLKTGLQVSCGARAPSDDGKPFSGRRVARWERSYTLWHGPRDARSWKGIGCRTRCACASRFHPNTGWLR
jgi:hypothetical protein